MPDVIVLATAPTTPVAPGRPKARLVASDTGEALELPWAPQETSLDGSAAMWSMLDRPGRKPLVVKTGEGLLTMTFTVMLGGLDDQQSCAADLAKLRRFAADGYRIQFLYSSLEAGYWRITALSIASITRAEATNDVTRATVNITLTEDVQPALVPGALTIIAPPAPPAPIGGGTTGAWTTYRWKKGDKLYQVSAKLLGAGERWREIAIPNGIATKSSKIPVGTVLRIPPR